MRRERRIEKEVRGGAGRERKKKEAKRREREREGIGVKQRRGEIKGRER